MTVRSLLGYRMTHFPDPDVVAKHVIKLMGGHEEAWHTFEADFKLITERWEQDITTIGRILRAHLFVEHFLSEYVQARNPDLGSLDEARVTFAQKVSLVGAGTPAIAYLLPGVRRLNTVRNRLAHSFRAEVTQEDTDVFLQIDLFRAMRDERAKRQSMTPSTDPVDLLEEFAGHAGSCLHHSATRNAEVWAEAIKMAQDECSSI